MSCDNDLIKKSCYRAFNAIYGKVGTLASVDVVIELLKTKCIPLLYGLNACRVSPQQLRSFNHVVVSCGRKMFNVNTSEIAVLKNVCDVAEAVATSKDRFVTRYVLSSSVVCEICSIFS